MVRVFLSSTSKDLRDYRGKVAEAINQLPGFECEQMETWGAVDASAVHYDEIKIAECDVLVLLLGAIYGTCPPGSDKSFTELEYEKAVELGKPRIVFTASGKFKPDLELMDSLPADDLPKRKAFRECVGQERIWAEFTHPHQLANQVTQAILKWQAELQQASLEKFLARTIEANAEISLRGVMQTERQVAVKLDEVYVSLKTQREVSRPLHDFMLPGLNGPIATLGSSEDDLDESVPIPGGRVRWADRTVETRTEKVDLAAAVREHDRIVILGDPGAGKTTLMRFLALHFAQAWRDGDAVVADKDGNEYGKPKLPILMRVADYAEELRHHRNAKLRDSLLLTYRNDEHASDGSLSRLLQEKLKQGEALLLLDGLDEVTEAGDRAVIANQIEDFVRNIHRDNRIIITSRIAGYRQAALGDAYHHFTLLDLEREQIEKFLNRWCPATERFLSKDASAEQIARRAQREIDGILKSVDGNTGVKRLATNPLLLTILALIHRNGARLPSRRVELYELATKTLLADWQAAKGMDSTRLIKDSDAAQFLWPLAYWMHAEKPRGLAYEQEVKAKLAEFRSRTHNLPPDHPDVVAVVDDFLDRARRSTGIFVERAPQQFGFMHLSFQEYFAARELTRSSRQSARRIHEVRHKPRWEEPILLAIASRQSPEDGSELVRAGILAEGELAAAEGFKPSEYEDVLHRDLFLAARCLADDVAVFPELRGKIVHQLCHIYFDSKTPGSLWDDIRRSFALLTDCVSCDDLAEILIKQLADPVTSVRVAAARAFSAMGEKAGQKQVISALIERLYDSAGSVRNAAAQALGAMGEKAAQDQILFTLIELLGNSEWQMRNTVAHALGEIGEKAAQNQVISALIKRLSDPIAQVRGTAASALGAMGEKVAQDRVISALIERLADSEEDVRDAAARALGAMGKNAAQDQVISSLIERLANSKRRVRTAAARALGTMNEKVAQNQVISSLMERLADSKWRARSMAARALGAMSEKAAHDQVISALLERLADLEGEVRAVAARALGAMGEKAAQDQVISALIEHLADSEWQVRSAVARALGALGEKAAQDQVLSALIERLADSKWQVRDAIARALGAMGERAAQDQVISALIERLGDKEWQVRSPVVRALGALGGGEPQDQVISALIKRLADSEKQVRSAAARALGALGEMAASEQVISALVRLLADSDENMQSAAGVLGEGASSEQSIPTLIQFSADSDWDVWSAAAESLGKLACHVSEEAKPAIIKLVLPLARNNQSGEKRNSKREAGYRVLRNLLAAKEDVRDPAL